MDTTNITAQLAAEQTAAALGFVSIEAFAKSKIAEELAECLGMALPVYDSADPVVVSNEVFDAMRALKALNDDDAFRRDVGIALGFTDPPLPEWIKPRRILWNIFQGPRGWCVEITKIENGRVYYKSYGDNGAEERSCPNARALQSFCKIGEPAQCGETLKAFAIRTNATK